MPTIDAQSVGAFFGERRESSGAMKIRIDNMFKRFSLPTGKQLNVLENLNFEIGEGDFLMILGESGCGKSTLLNLMAGLMPPTSGQIIVDDQEINSPHPTRAILFQQPALLPWLNVEQNISFGCRLRGERKNLDVRTRQLIEIMGLAGLEKIHPPELSLGQAQRVCLARALIGHPEILLLDEPFAALDTTNRSHLQEELIEFWQIEDLTVIFVTHDVDEAILMGNRIVLLGGRPTRVVAIYDVELAYPRDATDDAFYAMRNRILSKIRESFVGNRDIR
jgi:ABC-type nitrate/sulfonate/bicarbonate transport system ATPase subunit